MEGHSTKEVFRMHNLQQVLEDKDMRKSLESGSVKTEHMGSKVIGNAMSPANTSNGNITSELKETLAEEERKLVRYTENEEIYMRVGTLGYIFIN